MEITYDKEIKRLHKKYPALVAWHKQTGSYDYYINNLLIEAEATLAPRNAIYKRGETWRTTNDVQNAEALQKIVERLIKQIKH